MDRLDPVQDAKDHISDIRRQRGVSAHGDISENMTLEDLAQALKLLSQDLYSQETHFLLELLQNADDCTYDAHVLPSWELRLYPNRLETFCNEVGFNKYQVKSLCRIGHSTKSKNRVGMTGEKGIGFKSVFKIASVAKILSGPYSFQFDTRNPLYGYGMLIPTWVEPETHSSRDGTNRGTLITLQYKDGYREAEPNAVRFNIDPASLLFLRRLRKVTIKRFLSFSTHSHDEEIERKQLPIQESERCLISRKDAHNNISETEYRLFRGLVTSMPFDERRDGITDSSVALAFPLQHGQPYIDDQYAFAFLPIQKYGFQFLMHADFLLTTSREEIDAGSWWNTHLRKNLASLFRDAVHELSRSNTEGLAYGWPRYLKSSKTMTPSFLAPIAEHIETSLKGHSIVRTESGSFCSPSESKIVPNLYRWANDDVCFVDGHPPRWKRGDLLLDDGSMAAFAVSRSYSADALTGLKTLGVKDLSPEGFLAQFRKFFNRDQGCTYRKREGAWHSELAKVLLQTAQNVQRRRYSSKTIADVLECKNLKMIPLRDGSWTSIASGDIFMDQGKQTAAYETPEGISLRLVAEEAARDPRRRQLFRSLGVEICNRGQICNLILRLHAEAYYRIPRLRLDVWISHAVYLFDSGQQPSWDKKLFFVNVTLAATSDTLYIDFGPEAASFCDLLKDSNFQDRLHPDYEKAVTAQRQAAWLEWLLRWPNIQSRPPIEVDGKLSPHFREILNVHGSKRFLTFLKDNWPWYRDQLGPAGSRSEAVLSELKRLQVDTITNGLKPLEATALPALSQEADGYIAILALENPDDGGWRFLDVLGVMVQANLDFYLEKLINMRHHQPSPTYHHSDLISTYENIQRHAGENPYLLRDTVASYHLIYTERFGWQDPDSCVWEATFDCTAVTVLSKIYESCHELFGKVLHIPNATVNTVVEELKAFEPQNEGDVQRAKELLLAFSRLLRSSTISESIYQQLSKRAFIPVWQERSVKVVNFVAFPEVFWIADRPALLTAFQGLIWLADFSISEVNKIRKLIKAFKMDRKLLSNAVKERIDKEGDAVYNPRLTLRLTNRVSLVMLLVTQTSSYKSASEMDLLKRQLQNIRVYGIDSVTLRRQIQEDRAFGARIYHGRPIDGRAILERVDDSDSLHIYLPHSDVEIEKIRSVLTIRIGEHCGLDDRGMRLLTYVLENDDTQEVEETLENEGFEIVRQTVTPALNLWQHHVDVGSEKEDDHGHAGSPSAEMRVTERRPTTPMINIHGSVNWAYPSALESPPDIRHIGPGRPSSGSTLMPPQINIPRRRSESTMPSIQLNQKEGLVSHSGINLNSVREAARAFNVENITITCRAQPSSINEIDTATSDGVTGSSPRTSVRSADMPSFTFSSSIRENELMSTSVLRSDLSTNGNAGVAGPRSATQDQGDKIFDLSGLSEAISSSPRRRSRDASPRAIAASSKYTRAGHGGIPDSHLRSLSSGGGGSLSRSNGIPGDHVDTVAHLLTPEDLRFHVTRETQHEIGLAGETFVFELLKKLLGQDFTRANWTSRNSNYSADATFTGPEKDYADLTFVDTSGKLSRYFADHGFTDAKHWSQANVTYHLEVKASPWPCNTPFFLSNNQMGLARRYAVERQARPPRDVYVVFRVFDLNLGTGEAKVHAYMDPWQLMVDGKLTFEAQGGFVVTPP